MGRDGRAHDIDTGSGGRHADGNRSDKTGQLLIRAHSNRFGNSRPASASTTVAFSVLGFSNPSTLPGGSTSTLYSLHLMGVGGTPPYTFSSANAPAGLGVSSSGVLSGTPTKAGTFSFTVQITDANGSIGTGHLQPDGRVGPAADSGYGPRFARRHGHDIVFADARSRGRPAALYMDGNRRRIAAGPPVDQRGHHHRYAYGDRYGSVYGAGDGFLGRLRRGSIHDHHRPDAATDHLDGVTQRYRGTALRSATHQRIRRFCALHLCDYARRAAFTSDLQQRADQQWCSHRGGVVRLHGHGDGCCRQHGERRVHGAGRAERAGSGSLSGIGIVLHRHERGESAGSCECDRGIECRCVACL